MTESEESRVRQVVDVIRGYLEDEKPVRIETRRMAGKYVRDDLEYHDKRYVVRITIETVERV